MWAAITNIIIGLLLILAPPVFSLDKSVADHFYIIGPVVITFAFVALWEVNGAACYFNIPAGLWLVAAPFLFNFPTGTWLAITSGMLIVLLSFFRKKVKGNYGGGWRSLMQEHPAHMQEKPPLKKQRRR